MQDRVTVKYVGLGNHPNDTGAIRTLRPVAALRRAFYYEVTVLSAGQRGELTVGFAGKDFPLTRQPGWEEGSYGYRGDNGLKFGGTARGMEYGPPFATGDVVGCGLNYSSRTIFYTLNGKHLGVAFRVSGASMQASGGRLGLFPTVALHGPGELARVNLGAARFRFDLDNMLQTERDAEQANIQRALHNPDDAAVLVREYLLREGYQDTLAAWSREGGCASVAAVCAPEAKCEAMQVESKGAGSGSACSSTEGDGEESPSARGDDHPGTLTSLCIRQELRQLLLEGDAAGAAAARTEQVWPGLLAAPTNRRLFFQLRCQQFVELVLQAGGEVGTAAGGAFGAPPPPAAPRPPLLALEFAQSELAAFGHPGQDPREAVELQNLLGLVAYPDPCACPLAWLLAPSRREMVADALNAAVLRAMRAPPTSKLETALRQLVVAQDALLGGCGERFADVPCIAAAAADV